MNKVRIENVSMIIPYLKAEYDKKCYDIIRKTLELTNGNKREAADILGVERTTLTMWVGRHAPEFIRYRFKKKKK